MPELTLRRAGFGDISHIARNNCRMAAETEDRQLDEPEVRIAVRALMEDASKGFYLLATDANEELVGQLMVTYEWSDWRNGTFWWIQSVFVEPSARRSGVYRAMYAHLLDEARHSPDICGVRLYVHRDNTRARETYAALGMVRPDYEMYEVDFVLPSH